MADELGFSISADVWEAIDQIGRMNDSLDNLLQGWDRTIDGIRNNDFGSVIANQIYETNRAIEDGNVALSPFAERYVKLQQSVNSASASYQRQAANVVLLKQQLNQLNAEQEALEANEDATQEQFDRLAIRIANVQVRLRSAEQAVVGYATKMESAQRAMRDYNVQLEENVEAQRRAIDEQNRSREIDTGRAIVDLPTAEDFQPAQTGLERFRESIRSAIEDINDFFGATKQESGDIIDPEEQLAIDKLQNQIDAATIAYNQQSAVVEELRQEYEYLADAQARLSAEGDEERLNRTTDALQQTSDALNEATVKLNGYDVKLRELQQSLKNVGTESDKTSKSIKRTGERVEENNTFFAQLSRSIRNITFYRIVRGVIKSITTAAKESAQAMAIWSEQFDTGATGAAASFNDNMSALASNMLFARNAIMAAAEPIISALTPAFNALASAIANAFNWLSHFLSALTGRSFYNKAIKNNVNYANSLNSSNKAQKAFLAGFDELEVVQEKQGKTAGESLGIDPSEMWEREEVESSMLNLTEPFRNAMASLRSIFDEHAEGLKTAAGNLWQSIGNLAQTMDTHVFDSIFDNGRIGALLFNDALDLLEWTLNTLSQIIDNFIAPFTGGFIDGFGDATTKIYEFLQKALKPVVDKVKEFFDLLNENPETTQEVAENIGYISGVIAGIIAPLAAIHALLTLIAANPIVVFISVLAIAILYIIKLIGMCKDKWDEMYEKSEPMREAIQGITDAFNFMRDGVKKVIDAFTGANKELDKESDEIFPGLQEGLEQGFSGFVIWWGQIWDFVIKLFTGKFKIHSPSRLFEGYGENIIQGLRNGIDNFMSKIHSAIDKIKEALDLSKMKETAKGWGSDFVDGLSTGIRNAKEWAKSAADAVAQGIASVLHFSRPDEGVLRDYETWMPDFMRGLATGIDTNADLVYSSVNNLASGMKSALTVPMLGIGDVSGSFGSDMGSFTEAQMNANASLADVFWQGCMAVVQAINDNQTEISIGDDVIGRAATRYNRRQAVINGGAY